MAVKPVEKSSTMVAQNPGGGGKKPATGRHRRDKKKNGGHKAVRDKDGKFVKKPATGKAGNRSPRGKAQNPAGSNPRKKRRKKRNPDAGNLLPLVGGAAAGAGLTIGFRAVLRGLKALAEPMKNPTVAALIANGVPGALGAVAWYYGKKKGMPVLVAIGAGMVAAATVFLVNDLVGDKIEEGIASLLNKTDGLWFQKQQQIAAQRQQQRTGALMRDIAPAARQLPSERTQQPAEGMWIDPSKQQQRPAGALQRDIPPQRSIRGRLTA